MAVTSPPSITALPDAPDPNNRTTFNALAYPWSVALDTFGTEVAALGANVYANATDAAASATSASASSTSAIAAANFKGAWSGLTGALAIPASVSHSGGLWLLLASVADVTAHTPGVSANWMRLGQVTMPRRTITGGSDPLVAGDLGGFVDITSGTFTLPYTAAATLGASWWTIVRNSGTGDVTHDPASSETIDGLTSFVMYPGEARIVHCDGSNFRSVLLQGFTKTFTASGTFTKPPGYKAFEGLLWGGGASGGKGDGSTQAGGGGGAACYRFSIPAANVGTTETVTIATGGAAVTVAATAGNNGGNSSFGSNIVSYGGVGNSIVGGGGGGLKAAGSTSTGGTPADGFNGGGNGGNSAAGSSSFWGGGGGAGGSTDAAYAGGASVWGGGGGGNGPVTTAGAGGTSTFGGAGGAGGTSGNGTAGTAPGGGGGATKTGTSSGAGARGELRIWGIV